MMNEIVIFPNPNQMTLLRKLQREICATGEWIPILPLCVKSEKCADLNAKITKIEAKNLEESEENGKKILFLKIDIEIDGNAADGKILFAYRKKNCDEKTEIPLLGEMSQSLKTFSPFKICLLESENFENGRTWKILREKWGKVGA